MAVIDSKKIREAAILLSALKADVKNAALENIALRLEADKGHIAEVNARDVERAETAGLPAPVIKRLRMDEDKVVTAAAGIRSLITLDDPAGKLMQTTEISEGLTLRKVTCPIGVVGVIFESRPDALIQIACLCLKSGNAVILKGGSEAADTNRLLTDIIKSATAGSGKTDSVSCPELPDCWINQLETRAEINEILKMDGDIDLLIPRGSNAFVKYIMDNTRIPVIGHSDGICHCYVDSSADVGMAVKIAVDAKTQYAAVCNAMETLLVHRDAAPALLPALWDALNGNGASSGGGISTGGGVSADGGDGLYYADSPPTPGRPRVEIRGDAETARILKGRSVTAASGDDWGAEYLDYILAVKIVDSIDEAIGHINRYGSHHTDVIITENADSARKFFQYVDSANVFHNCSTRFSDGFRYGFGAEVGVSTSKIHARGPVGLDGLVTYKYLLSGSGDTVADYESGRRKYTHKTL